jgi:O-antigen biosynthesis protein
MNSKPKISVVLTSFNHGRYLREAIDSILKQTFEDFELLIWDDASTDDSWSIIQSYTDERIRAFRNDEQRRGIFGINKSISELSRGNLIAIHHSDDIWEANKLERQMAFLETHSNIGAVFSNALVIDESGSPLDDPSHFYVTIFDQPNRSRYEWLRHFFYRGNALCHPSVLIRKECYQECGVYRFGLAQLVDFDMWIRLCLKFEIHVLPEKLVRFRVRANEANASGDKPEARIRGTAEHFILLKNYTNLSLFEDMAAVFPEVARHYRGSDFIPRFVLAMVALDRNTHSIAKAFAITELFDLLKDPAQAERIQSLYKFDYRDLIKITGDNDAFLSEALKTVTEQVAIYAKHLSNLQKSAEEVSTWAKTLNTDLQQRNIDTQELSHQLKITSDANKTLLVDKESNLQKIDRLKIELDKILEKTSGLQNALSNRDAEVFVLNERCQQLADECKIATALAAQREQITTDLNAELADLSNRANSLQQIISDREKTIENLMEGLQGLYIEQKATDALTLQREQHIAILNNELVASSNRTTALQKALSERDLSVENLTQNVGALFSSYQSESERIKEIRQELNELFRFTTRLREEVSQYKEIISVQEKSADKLHADKSALTEIYSERLALAEEKLARQHRDLMEISRWASKIDKQPLRHAVRRGASRILRALPAPASAAIRKFVRPKRNIATTKSKHQIKHNASHSIVSTKPCIPPVKKRADIFIFSVIDWSFRIQRPQHIARTLAKQGNRVFFFSNHFIDAAEAGYSVNQIDPDLELYEVKLNVSGAPPIYFAPPSAIAEQMISAAISALMLTYGVGGSISIVQHCYWLPIQRRIPDTYWVYDCMDHHEGFGNVPENLIDLEKQLMAHADLITVTSSWLYEFASQYHKDVALIRNGADYDFFATSPKEIFVDTARRKIIGYYGAIADWFDLELLEKIALAHPQALVLLIGEDTVCAREVLKHLPNVQFTGEVPYKNLPFYLYAFDVCLLPFKVMPLTLATNPVKVYEYLAAGKPVVAVDLPEMTQFDAIVHTARNYNEFLAYVSEILKTPGEDSTAAQRQAFAAQQTWAHRALQFCNCIEQLSLPKISVVVLAYNNLALTKACIHSLLEYSNYPNLEIIVVDNASSDDTPAYLLTLAADHQNIKLVLNTDNRGFAAGNNQGLKIATGDYLVILNNDTKVTPGWALTMLRHLLLDRTIGIIGPITNNIGNEARVDTQYTNNDEMILEARHLTLAKMGSAFPLRTVAFFCAMLPRHIYEKCGPLSEDFGLGFFEDDDYCRRIEALGYRIACADDVFVHHELSASFSKLTESVRQELFQKNKAVYEEKWGTWIPHVYR